MHKRVLPCEYRAVFALTQTIAGRSPSASSTRSMSRCSAS